MKRIVIRISLVLLLGVVTSVAVAWGCAWRAARMPVLASSKQRLPSDSEFAWVLYPIETFGFGWINRDADFADRWHPGQDVDRPPWWTTRDYQSQPYRMSARYGPLAPPGLIVQMRDKIDMGNASAVNFLEGEAACGWPMFCLHSEVLREHRVTITNKSPELVQNRGIVNEFSFSGSSVIAIDHHEKINATSKPSRSAFDFAFVLPYDPIWPGLLANTAIYGSAWCVARAIFYAGDADVPAAA